MKPILYLILLLAACCFPKLQAQTAAGSFVLVSTGSAGDTAPYITAIQHSDVESYRLSETRTRLSFDNGLTFELLSSSELLQSGMITSASPYRTTNAEGYTPPVLHMGADGRIAAEFQLRATKK